MYGGARHERLRSDVYHRRLDFHLPGCPGYSQPGPHPAPDTVDGSASTATFGYMGTMTTDGTTIWVASQHVLREINIATGDVTTVTGTRGSCGAIDGDRSTGLLHDARGLTYWNGLV